MRNLFLAGLCIFLLTSVKAAVNSGWPAYSDPKIQVPAYEKKFSNLPLAAAINDSQKLWANDYWPRRNGIINYRWNAKNPSGFKLISPTKEQLFKMSLEELATLAPSEKLDILNGNYNYPLKEESDSRSNPRAPIWHGICHGWSPASINHNEPHPKTLVNPDGIVVPFGSSDIKGLLSYYYAYKHEVVSTHQMGKRCQINFGPGCDNDLNAGAFHLVLTNKLGLENTSFVADIERGRQVWNHAANEYSTIVVNDNLAPASDSAKGTVRRVQVKTAMTVVMKIAKNNWEPVLGTEAQINEVRNYEYTLELNALGEIIGGEWISHARPDFIWTMKKAETFNGQFSRLSDLLND